MQIVLENRPLQAVMFPSCVESSLASRNYCREMAGMFKVNKMEGVLLAKYKQGFFFVCVCPLFMPVLFAIIYHLGNRQLLSGILS